MRTATMSAVAALGALATPPVRAEEESAPTVVVHAPARPTCVVTDELAEMLRRSGIRSVTGGAPAEAATEIEVQGTPERLTVSVRGVDRDATTNLPATKCATATDAVAAFVVSMLVPVAAATPTARSDEKALDEKTLEDTVKRELAGRGIQLVTIGRRLRIRRDDSGTFFVTLEVIDAPDCSRTTPLGAFEVISPLRVAAVADLATETLNAQEDCIAGPPGAGPKLYALREAVRLTDLRAKLMSVTGGLELASGAILFGFLADPEEPAPESPPFRVSYSNSRDAFLTSASIVAMGGGAASFFVSDDVKPAVVGVTGFAALGALFTAATLENEYDKTDYAFAALSAANYSTAALLAANAILHRPPIARVRAFRHELDGPRPRGAAIARAERDVARLSTPIPGAVTAAPLVAGSIIAMLPALLTGFEDRDCNAVAGAGLAFFVPGMFAVLSPDTYTRYRQTLSEVGIRDFALGFGPGNRGGLSLSGRF